MLARHIGLLQSYSPDIEFVGGDTFYSSDGTGPYSLTGLSGGIASSPSEGDLVVVAVSSKYSSDLTMTPTSSGWTSVADLYADDTNDNNLGVAYKVMGASPDTSVSFTNTNQPTYAVVYVLRNVDQSTPLDATSVTKTKTNTGVPNPSSITTVNNDSVVLAIGGAAGDSVRTLSTFTAPSGYSNFIERGVNTSRVGMGMKTVETAGLENPGAFGGGGAATTNSYCTVTMAIRKA